MHVLARVHPYRDAPPTPARDAAPDRPREETALAILVIFLGGLRVAAAIADRQPLAGEATVALVAMVVAAWALVPRALRRARWWRRRTGVLHDDMPRP